MEPPWIGQPQFRFPRAEPFQLGIGQPEVGFRVEGMSRIGSRLGLSNLMSLETNPHATNLTYPHKTGEIGQEMIIMVRIFLRKRYSIEG